MPFGGGSQASRIGTMKAPIVISVAMGEMGEAQNAVDQGDADCAERIDRAP